MRLPDRQGDSKNLISSTLTSQVPKESKAIEKMAMKKGKKKMGIRFLMKKVRRLLKMSISQMKMKKLRAKRNLLKKILVNSQNPIKYRLIFVVYH
jgi:hypothetical protein